MDDMRPEEEKSPLLLYIVEGEPNLQKNNKRANFDNKGRLYGISSGATAVFTDFPNYISPCWVTALLSSLTFLLMLLLMVSYTGPSGGLRVPRCTHNNNLENLNNKTVHLVHNLNNWTENQLEMLEKIKTEYQNYNIHLILIKPTENVTKLNDITKLPITTTLKPITTTKIKPNKTIELKRIKRAKKNLKRKKGPQTFEPFSIGFSMKSLLDLLLLNKIVKRDLNATNITELLSPTTTEPPKTLNSIINGLIIENLTMEQAFMNTPLQETWPSLSEELKYFAVRILQLWHYGGMSFKLDFADIDQDNIRKFSVAPQISLQKIIETNTNSNDKLLNFIIDGKRTFDGLPNEVVTADDEAFHIFTKSPCHVFFGEILLKLKRATADETPKQIIKKALRVFCRHSAVGNNYCRNIFKRSGY